MAKVENKATCLVCGETSETTHIYVVGLGVFYCREHLPPRCEKCKSHHPAEYPLGHPAHGFPICYPIRSSYPAGYPYHQGTPLSDEDELQRILFTPRGSGVEEDYQYKKRTFKEGE